MSIFGTILEKLGIKHPASPALPAAPAAAASQPAPQAPPLPPQAAPSKPTPPPVTPIAPPGPPPYQAKPPAPQSTSAPSAPPPFYTAAQLSTPAVSTPPAAPAEIPMVDVVSKLEHLAATNPQRLDWKVSIVDLLKLLDLDSSFEARKQLATELDCPADKMGDSAQMNTWLHKMVLQKLAENGGNIPKELLD